MSKELPVAIISQLEKLSAALNASDTVTAEAVKASQAVLGAFTGAAFAFSKNAAYLSAFMKEGFKRLGKSALSKYSRQIKDYIRHECGISELNGVYSVSDTKALQKAADEVKTFNVLNYESAETISEKENKKEEKKLEKAKFTDASAKDRVLMFLNAKLSETQERLNSEEKKTGKNFNQKEIDKARDELKLIASVISFAEKQ